MQTFCPVESFVQSMEFLDYKRLGKQRVECGQILEVLLNVPILPKSLQQVVPFDRTHDKGWRNHPAVNMWRGHEQWLLNYFDICVGEWKWRGYNNNIVIPSYDVSLQPRPAWLGYEPFHRSHRSNLLRKNPLHYRKFWPDEDSDLSYFWPTHSPELMESTAVNKTGEGNDNTHGKTEDAYSDYQSF